MTLCRPDLTPSQQAYLVDLYSADGGGLDVGSAEHIGFCHILPDNLRQTTGTVTLPISGTGQQPIGQLTGNIGNVGSAGMSQLATRYAPETVHTKHGVVSLYLAQTVMSKILKCTD